MSCKSLNGSQFREQEIIRVSSESDASRQRTELRQLQEELDSGWALFSTELQQPGAHSEVPLVSILRKEAGTISASSTRAILSSLLQGNFYHMLEKN